MMDVNPWTIVFTLINFFILLLILKKFLYQPVKKMLAARAAEVKETYSRAECAKKEAQDLKEKYESNMRQSKAKANQLMQETADNAQRRGDEIVSQAEQKASRLLERAEEQIADEKKKAVNEMKNQMVDIALLAASRLMQKELADVDQENLMEEFIEKAGEINWQRP